jgi:hypothetical protein
VCDPSQKISRIERDTNVIYTHTRMELCAQYCVREAFYIFFIFGHAAALSSVFRLFLSLGRQVVDFSFLSSYRVTDPSDPDWIRPIGEG